MPRKETNVIATEQQGHAPTKDRQGKRLKEHGREDEHDGVFSSTSRAVDHEKGMVSYFQTKKHLHLSWQFSDYLS